MNNQLFDYQGDLNLEYPLIKFDRDKKSDWWKVRDAFEGVCIMGGIGSGKTSGSGKTIAKAFLRNNFGGLVMVAKSTEKQTWIDYAKETGRLDDLIIFGEGSEYQFNPLQYELTREGKGAGEIFNLSHLFMELYKLGARFSGGSGGESEQYWKNALQMCLNRVFQTLKLAGEEISINNMRKLISSAPTEENIQLLSEMSDEDLIKWADKNYCVGCILEGGERIQADEENEEHDLIYDYWMREFAKMPEKTRGTVEQSFYGLAEPFMSGILKKYFSKGTNITPEMTFNNNIIIVDFSVKEYLSAGVYAQGIFKLLWQQAIERRDIKKYPKPAFLWCDESQYFVNEADTIFMTTARSSRACAVYLTQNISNYYAQMGGAASKSKVDSLLANLSTKVFHCNADSVTNEWASKVIGYDLITLRSDSEQRKNFSFIADSVSKSFSAQLLPQVLPREFTTLWSGGTYYNLKVQAIMQIKGREWSNKANYQRVTFSQQ